jgi:hypothetical protein
LNFLNRGHSASEVSIDPNGDVFPCCLKTAKPLDNLAEERLDDILDSLVGHPVFEAGDLDGSSGTDGSLSWMGHCPISRGVAHDEAQRRSIP